jgi:hydroxyacylglutathione hydrolase
MKAWHAAGFPSERIGQMSVHELNEQKSSLQVIDVRSPGEWKKGHVPGARHVFLPEIEERAKELDRSKPTAIYCGSGYRASSATSILKRHGFKDLWNVPGSWEAWKKAKLPVEGADGA